MAPEFWLLDVGAAGGFSAFAELHPYCTLIGFEPDPASYRRLCQDIYPQSRFRAARAEPWALAATPGPTTLYLTHNPEMNSLLPLDWAQFKRLFGYAPGSHFWQTQMAPRGTSTVTATTLDIYCHDQNVREIDYLKLDAQGAETQILAGAAQLLAQHRVALVQTEVTLLTIYQGQAHLADTHQLLQGYGYQMLDCQFYPGAVRAEGPAAWAAPGGRAEKTRYYPVGDALYLLSPGMLTPSQRHRAAILLGYLGYVGAAAELLATNGLAAGAAAEILATYAPPPSTGGGFKQWARDLCPPLLARAARRWRSGRPFTTTRARF